MPGRPWARAAPVGWLDQVAVAEGDQAEDVFAMTMSEMAAAIAGVSFVAEVYLVAFFAENLGDLEPVAEVRADAADEVVGSLALGAELDDAGVVAVQRQDQADGAGRRADPDDRQLALAVRAQRDEPKDAGEIARGRRVMRASGLDV